MRQVVIDTETTGLNPQEGHRIIELACIEIIDRKLTGRRFHTFINPERVIDSGAIEVHGLTNEFLADKPKFGDIVDGFIDFIRDAQLIIHNASFDIGFLNRELGLMGLPQIDSICMAVVDSLRLARTMHPGQRNSLGALCQRYQVGNSQRDGALHDAELLAGIYLKMTADQPENTEGQVFKVRYLKLPNKRNEHRMV